MIRNATRKQKTAEASQVVRVAAADLGAGARVKIKWAEQYIRDLNAGFNEFLSSEDELDRPAIEPRPDLGENLVGVDIPLRVPPEWWGALIGDVVHNLRSALDLLACQLVLSGPSPDIGPTVSTSFPIPRKSESSPEKYESFIRGKIQDSPEGAVDLIKGLEPYPGGNGEPLWVLNQLSISDKHHLLVPVMVEFPVGDGPPMVVRRGNYDPKTGRMAEGSFSFTIPSRDDLAKRKAAGKGEVDVDVQKPGTIAFDKPGVVEGEPVIPTLTQVHESVVAAHNVIVPLLR